MQLRCDSNINYRPKYLWLWKRDWECYLFKPCLCQRWCIHHFRYCRLQLTHTFGSLNNPLAEHSHGFIRRSSSCDGTSQDYKLGLGLRFLWNVGIWRNLLTQPKNTYKRIWLQYSAHGWDITLPDLWIWIIWILPEPLQLARGQPAAVCGDTATWGELAFQCSPPLPPGERWALP